jgi:hypothetical protein
MLYVRDPTKNHLRDHAVELAVSTLERLDFPTHDPDLVVGGAQAFVVRFPDANLCVRITFTDHVSTLRGYAVSEALGPDVALPLIQAPTKTEDATMAVFPLAQVIDDAGEAWASAINLVCAVHEHTIDPAWDVPTADPVGGLGTRLSSLESSPYHAWVPSLRKKMANLDAAAKVAARHRPHTLLHGDVHGAQAMSYQGSDLLIDFDRVARGPIEVDYGRLWAFFKEGRLEEGLFATLYENSPEDPSYGLVATYGQMFVIRDATWLAARSGDLGEDALWRLASCAVALGLDLPYRAT